MTFAQRLAQHVEKAPSRVTMNTQKKPVYNWENEAKQKRSIR